MTIIPFKLVQSCGYNWRKNSRRVSASNLKSVINTGKWKYYQKLNLKRVFFLIKCKTKNKNVKKNLTSKVG